MSTETPGALARIDCVTCAAQLPDYVRRELDGEPVQRLLPAMALHIETCPACERAYLRAFRRAGERRSVAALRRAPLWPGVAAVVEQITARPVSPTWSERTLAAGRAWVERASGRLRQFEVQVGSLLQSPPPPLELALAGLQSESTAEPSARLQVTSHGDGFDLAVRILGDRSGREDFCRLEVTIALHDRLGDFGGAEILLVANQVQTAFTDVLGRAKFEDVLRTELPALRLSVSLPADPV
jgi:hypothetical protein